MHNIYQIKKIWLGKFKYVYVNIIHRLQQFIRFFTLTKKAVVHWLHKKKENKEFYILQQLNSIYCHINYTEMKFGIILRAQSGAVLPIRIQIVYRKSRVNAEFLINSIQLWAFIQDFLWGSSATETMTTQNMMLYIAVIIQVLP